MSSPSTDDASTASLEPTQFHSFHINKAPAMVSWVDDDNQSRTLSGDASGNEHVALDVLHDPDAGTVMFKIIANVAYKGKRNKSNVFLHVYPERIRALSIVENEESAARRLGTSAFTLEFALSMPSALVVPSGDWVPKNEAAQFTLASIEVLSRATAFRVVFASRTLAKARLASLCEKASTSGTLTTTPDAINLTKLYGGQGGKILDCKLPKSAAQNAPEQSEAADSPPSYGDIGDQPPAHPSQVRKRRRVDSDDGVDGLGSSSHEKMSLEEICRNGFAQIGRRFDRIEQSLGDLTARLGRVEQLVREHHLREPSGPDDQGRQLASTVDERINQVEERVTGVELKLETGLGDLARDVENQMHDVRNEFHDQITVRVDDEVGVAQSNLEDFVKDELYNAASEVEETIRKKLSDALC